jgi:hypothetical protein
MSKDNRIIEQNLLDKVLAKAVQDYEKHGITHEVPEEERQKALEIGVGSGNLRKWQGNVYNNLYKGFLEAIFRM